MKRKSLEKQSFQINKQTIKQLVGMNLWLVITQKSYNILLIFSHPTNKKSVKVNYDQRIGKDLHGSKC